MCVEHTVYCAQGWLETYMYPESGLAKETREFYENFFGYDVSEEKIQEILSGRGMRLSKNRKKTLR